MRDFSRNPDLGPLAQVASAIQMPAAALGVPFFLVGAAARDLLLLHGFGIDTGSATRDMDFAIMVTDWNTFDALRGALLAGGEFTSNSGDPLHKLWHRAGIPLDIVPFGGIERPDRTIAWPPDHAEVFECFGFREALATVRELVLPGDARISVPSIAALALLKIIAWRDRRYTGHDAPDLMLYARNHIDCDNMDRVASEHTDLLQAENYDNEAAGAQLLGRDIAALLDGAGIERVLTILLPESEADAPLVLAHQSGFDLERARELIAALCEGLKDRL